jgi:hypothetical protein
MVKELELREINQKLTEEKNVSQKYKKQIEEL